jgi:hypothetical protein
VAGCSNWATKGYKRCRWYLAVEKSMATAAVEENFARNIFDLSQR